MQSELPKVKRRRLKDIPRAAEAYPPGWFVSDELDARAMTSHHLALFSDLPDAVIDAVIVNKQEITPEIAAGLANGFHTSVEFWLNLQTIYRAKHPIPTRAEKVRTLFIELLTRSLILVLWIIFMFVWCCFFLGPSFIQWVVNDLGSKN